MKERRSGRVDKVRTTDNTTRSGEQGIDDEEGATKSKGKCKLLCQMHKPRQETAASTTMTDSVG